MQIKMAIDHLNLSQQMGGKNILLLQCSLHLRVIITRSTIRSASPPGSSIGMISDGAGGCISNTVRYKQIPVHVYV